MYSITISSISQVTHFIDIIRIFHINCATSIVRLQLPKLLSARFWVIRYDSLMVTVDSEIGIGTHFRRCSLGDTPIQIPIPIAIVMLMFISSSTSKYVYVCTMSMTSPSTTITLHFNYSQFRSA